MKTIALALLVPILVSARLDRVPHDFDGLARRAHRGLVLDMMATQTDETGSSVVQSQTTSVLPSQSIVASGGEGGQGQQSQASGISSGSAVFSGHNSVHHSGSGSASASFHRSSVASATPTLSAACRHQKTKKPANRAPSTLTIAQGCARFATAGSESSCNEVLSQSHSKFSLLEFQQFNPSVGPVCWGIQAGRDYCVELSACLSPNALTGVKGCTKYAQDTTRYTTPNAFAKAHEISIVEFDKLNHHTKVIVPKEFYCVSDRKSSLLSPTTSSSSSSTATSNTKGAALLDLGDASGTTVQPATTPVETTSSAVNEEPTTKAATKTPFTSEIDTTTTASPSPSPKKGGGSGGSQGYGDATFFKPGLGSCGLHNTSADFIFAASADLYAITGDALCGTSITVTRTSNGATATGVVVDKCPADECTPCSLDMSPAVFDQIATVAEGRVGIHWNVDDLPFSSNILSRIAAACAP